VGLGGYPHAGDLGADQKTIGVARRVIRDDGDTTIMRTLGIVLGVIVGGIAVLVAVYEFGYTHRYRYRLTLDVDVDGQVKTGSGVIQVTHRPDLVPGRPFPHYGAGISGEAVYVDLGQRGNLLALLTGPDKSSPFDLAAKTFNSPQFVGATEDAMRWRERLARLRAHADLRPDQLPMLVTFKDLNDPKSILQVYPSDLSAAFGPGVTFKRATIEMTRDPVTIGIVARLPWLATMKGYLDGRFSSEGLTTANSLSPADFKWTADFKWWLS
jgi:hypothetical protein